MATLPMRVVQLLPICCHGLINAPSQAATSETSVAAAVKRFGRLTGVCLNAGVMGPCYRLDSAPVDKWEKACAINVFSHLHTVS